MAGRFTQAHRANAIAPRARHEERRTLLLYAGLSRGCSVLEAGGWDGYLGEALALHNGPVTLIERDDKFVAKLKEMYPQFDVVVGKQEEMPVTTCSVDRVLALVSLHHIPTERFISEAARVLAPNGRVAICEVRKGGKVADFLDGQVASMTGPRGHRGNYFARGGWSTRFEAVGLLRTIEDERTMHWRFASRLQAIDYCRAVFGLEADDERISRAIDSLEPAEGPDGFSWAWPLVFATADAI